MKHRVASRLEPTGYVRRANLQIGLAMGSDTLDIDFALKFKHSPARVFRQVNSPTSCGRRITLLPQNYRLEGNKRSIGLPLACRMRAHTDTYGRERTWTDPRWSLAPGVTRLLIEHTTGRPLTYTATNCCQRALIQVGGDRWHAHTIVVSFFLFYFFFRVRGG